MARLIQRTLVYRHVNADAMEGDDRARYKLIRQAGIPIPSPISREELIEMAHEARLLLNLKTKDRVAWQREVARLNDWIQPKASPDSLSDSDGRPLYAFTLPNPNEPVPPVDQFFRVGLADGRSVQPAQVSVQEPPQAPFRRLQLINPQLESIVRFQMAMEMARDGLVVVGAEQLGEQGPGPAAPNVPNAPNPAGNQNQNPNQPQQMRVIEIPIDIPIEVPFELFQRAQMQHQQRAQQQEVRPPQPQPPAQEARPPPPPPPPAAPAASAPAPAPIAPRPAVQQPQFKPIRRPKAPKASSAPTAPTRASLRIRQIPPELNNQEPGGQGTSSESSATSRHPPARKVKKAKRAGGRRRR